MLVCSSREIGYEFYKNVIALRPEWAEIKIAEEGTELSDKDKREIKPIERIKMIMTIGKDDPKEMYDLLGTNPTDNTGCTKRTEILRSIVFKLTKGNAPEKAQMNARVREVIKDPLESDGILEIFKIGDETQSEQDIFDEDYLAKINKIKLPNTKIKLLQQLLARAIREIKKSIK